MQSNTSNVITVTLVLNEEEAKWLSAQMQNPLHGQAPTEESAAADARMRKAFFDATTLVKIPHF